MNSFSVKLFVIFIFFIEKNTPLFEPEAFHCDAYFGWWGITSLGEGRKV